jgi:hypothetical protein
MTLVVACLYSQCRIGAVDVCLQAALDSHLAFQAAFIDRRTRHGSAVTDYSAAVTVGRMTLPRGRLRA